MVQVAPGEEEKSDGEAKADARAFINQIKNVTGLWETDPDEVRVPYVAFGYITVALGWGCWLVAFEWVGLWFGSGWVWAGSALLRTGSFWFWSGSVWFGLTRFCFRCS